MVTKSINVELIIMQIRFLIRNIVTFSFLVIFIKTLCIPNTIWMITIHVQLWSCLTTRTRQSLILSNISKIHIFLFFILRPFLIVLTTTRCMGFSGTFKTKRYSTSIASDGFYCFKFLSFNNHLTSRIDAPFYIDIVLSKRLTEFILITFINFSFSVILVRTLLYFNLLRFIKEIGPKTMWNQIVTVIIWTS